MTEKETKDVLMQAKWQLSSFVNKCIDFVLISKIDLIGKHLDSVKKLRILGANISTDIINKKDVIEKLDEVVSIENGEISIDEKAQNEFIKKLYDLVDEKYIIAMTNKI